MKISINLPEALLKEVTEVTGSKTKVEAIKKALLNTIEQGKRKKLINYMGKIDFFIDLDILRKRKLKSY